MHRSVNRLKYADPQDDERILKPKVPAHLAPRIRVKVLGRTGPRRPGCVGDFAGGTLEDGCGVGDELGEGAELGFYELGVGGEGEGYGDGADGVVDLAA